VEAAVFWFCCCDGVWFCWDAAFAFCAAPSCGRVTPCGTGSAAICGVAATDSRRGFEATVLE